MRILCFAAGAPDCFVFESAKMDLDTGAAYAVDVVLMLFGSARTLGIDVPSPEVSPRRSATPRSRLVFDRLRNFPHSEIDNVIPLTRKIPQPIKSLTDLARQLVKFPGRKG